jgi:tetratricopeptide (TPR) repeat protein
MLAAGAAAIAQIMNMIVVHQKMYDLKIGGQTSMNERQRITEDIVALARQNSDLAFEQINKIIEEKPDEYWAWSLRSYVYSTIGDFENAIDDIDHAINIEFYEPSNHQEKAIILIQTNDISGAIYCLSNSIEIGEKFDISYYESYCRFIRAFCYCKIGDFFSAEQDLLMVDDEDTAWIDRLRTKAELLEACRNQRLD